MSDLNRIKGTILILVVTITTVFCGFILTTRTTSSISHQLALALEQAQQGDNNQTIVCTDAAFDDWTRYSAAMMVFISHDRIDRIDEAFNNARNYLHAGNMQQFHIECRRTRLLLDHLNKMEYPTIDNII